MDSSSSSSSEPPKLALYSFPSNRRSDGPGELTPPVTRTVASIPFQWEEAPGKPRPSCCSSTADSKRSSSSTVKRSLELPPRLVLTDHYYHNNNSYNVSSSPTTVLEGPYVARSLSSYTLSFRKGGSSSFRIPAASESKDRVLFGSSRWVSGTATSTSVKKNDQKVVGGTFNFFPPSADTVRGAGGPKVKITRVRKRSGSFRSLSHSSSHLWTNICESFKQVVPWRLVGKRN